MEPVVLVMCPPWGVNTPPLGIAYLKGYLESYGRTVHAIDFNVEVYHRIGPQYQKYWGGAYLDLWSQEFFEMMGIPIRNEMEWCLQRIASLQPKVVGFSVNQSNLYFSFEIAKRLRKLDPGVVIIFGGPGVFWVDQNRNIPIGLMDEHGDPVLPMEVIDVFIHGEGEETLEAVLRKLERGEDLKSVNAVTARIDGAYLTTGHHRPNLQPDQFPFPVFDWVNFDAYYEVELGFKEPSRLVPIILSRGCTNSCRFCNDWVMQGRYRFRSPENVFEEIHRRVVHEGFKRLFFCDLLVNGNLAQLKTLAQLLVHSGLPEKYQLTWRGQALARGDMDEEYLKLLKASGCCSLTYGVESLSDKVLLAMHKNITVADIESVLKATRAAGIVPQINLIVGYPGEGEKEFQETIENLKRFGQYIDRVSSFSMLTMTYGSPLFRKAWRSKGTQEVMEWHRRWVLEEDPDNTFEVRDERFKRLQTVVEGLGLPTLAAQHYEDAFAQAQQELAKPPTGNSGENCECG